MASSPRVRDHWQKIAVVVLLLVAYFVISGLLFGWHRLGQDWLPLDRSIDGPNLLVSFIWLPIAFLGGWIVSEIRAAKLHRHLDARLEEHHAKMADLLGIASPDVADALNSTPGDRQLDNV